MKKTLFFSVLIFLFFNHDSNAQTNWKTLKTGAGGWTTGLDIHPSGNPIYVRSDVGGAYRWNPSTEDWINIVTEDNLPASDVYWNRHAGVLSIVSAPSNNNIAYLAYIDGIYRSTDQGDNWTRTNLAAMPMNPNSDESKLAGERLAVDPNNANIVYFGSINNGLWRTTNGGNNWTQITDVPAGTSSRGIRQIVFDKSSPLNNGNTSRILAVVDGAGIFQSTNAGTSWQSTNFPYSSPKFYDAEIDNNGLFYVVGEDTNQGRFGARRLNGNSWSQVFSGNRAMGEIAIDPFDPNRIFLFSEGFTDSYRTTNGNAASPTWQSVTTSQESKDIPWMAWSGVGWFSLGEIVFDPSVPNTMWKAEGVGTWRTTDLFDSDMAWVDYATGQEHMISNDIIDLPNDKVVTAFWDRPIFHHTDLDVYPSTYKPSSRFNSCWDLDQSATDRNFLVGIIEDHRFCCKDDNTRSSGYSEDGGLSWTRFPTMPNPLGGQTYNQIYGNIAVAASDKNNIVWAPTENILPYYTLNRGQSWTQISLPDNVSSCCHTKRYFYREGLASDKVLDRTFYMYRSETGSFYKTSNGGQSWVKYANVLPANAYHPIIKPVPGHAGHIIYTHGSEENIPGMRGVFYSTNGGQSWTEFQSTDEVINVALGKAAPGATYPSIFMMGKVNGVLGYYMSIDKGQNWQILEQGYPLGINARAKVMRGDLDVHGRLYVGFGGRSFIYHDFNNSGNCPVAGTPCDDGDPNTTNDVENGNCVCAGTVIPCPVAGTACNDGNENTINDIEDGNCGCAGTSICQAAGTVCDDGNPNTINDVEDGNCVCSGSNGISVCNTETPIIIDGNSNQQWDAAPSHAISKVLAGSNNSSGDIAANFKILWDATYLYVSVKVTDDILINDSTSPWFDDSVELYLDGGNEKGTSYDSNDHQLVFAYDDLTVYHPQDQNNPTGINFTSLTTATGYDLEIRIAWSFLGVSADQGTVVGLDVQINDDDDGDSRDTKLTWHAETDFAWNNPSLIGTIHLNSCDNNQCPVAGTACNDNDSSTTNDVEDGNCNCAGVACPAAGTVCNDNNSSTINDIEDGNCQCAGTPSNGADCGTFSTTGSKILNPCGNEFYGVGMNAAFNVLAGPFVFQGLDNRPGPCNSAFDIWPGQTNYVDGTECYPGGGVNSFDVWSPQLNSVVSLPDRYYAMNGTLTQTAVAAGISQPADHWHQNILRTNMICEGVPTPPTPSDIIPASLPAIQEAVDAGMVVIASMHNTTAQNITPNAAWNSPTSAFSGKFGCSMEVLDAVVSEFKTDGSGNGTGTKEVKQGYVWFEPTNEPWDDTSTGGCPPEAYFSTQSFFIERIRNYHNAENIIVIDLHNWAQSLNLLAGGCYDDWWTSLKNHPSGDLTRNVVMSWHNYGAQHAVGGYTYAAMDAQLNTVLNTGTAGGYTYPLTVGEYGQAAAIGAGNAGPDQWNRDGFEFMMTNIHGQALAEKYNIHPTVWNATGDSGFWVTYKLTHGPSAGTDDGLAIPFWDIESGNDPYLEPLGVAHWNMSHSIWNKNVSCSDSCDDCLPAGTACDDNNDNTIDDIEDGDCICSGTPINECPLAGTSCDDDNDNTINDIEDGNCNCSGTPINGCPIAGTACDDGDSNTTNDIEDGDCSCSGTTGITICESTMPIIIDGVLNEEWTSTPPIELTNVLYGSIDNSSDLSATFQAQWDANYLYIFGTITDDALVNDSAAPWHDDSVELYLDGGNEKGSTYDSNDHQLLFAYNDATIYHPSGEDNPQGVDFIQVASATSYSVEIRIAWTFLGLTAEAATQIGLDIQINDDDLGGNRDKKISWQANTDTAWSNPSLFGVIQLDSCQECVQDIVMTSPNDNQSAGDHLYEVAGSIYSSSHINGTAKVDYSAQNSIELQTGFEVKLGARFHAYIEGCN